MKVRTSTMKLVLGHKLEPYGKKFGQRVDVYRYYCCEVCGIVVYTRESMDSIKIGDCKWIMSRGSPTNHNDNSELTTSCSNVCIQEIIE